MKLWPSGQVRPIRFHHLRHTTASLLLMRGADVPGGADILRHSDPRLTTETYGHLVPDYLRDQIDRLTFGALPPSFSKSGTSQVQARRDDSGSVCSYFAPGRRKPGKSTFSPHPRHRIIS